MRSSRAGQRGGDVGEQPRPPEAAAADDHPVAAGPRDHGHGVLGGEDVAVAEHGHLGGQGVAQPGDRVPVGARRVQLGRGAPVQRHPGGALVDGDPAGVEVGEVVLVDALAHLHRDRDAGGLGGADHGADDGGEQLGLPGQGRSPAAPGDLGDRAAEVEVDVLGAVVLEQHLDRAGGGGGVGGVQLDALDRLVGVVLGEPQRLRRPLDEGAAGHHLRHVQPGPAAELAAQPPERGVGDAGHRGEDDRGVEGAVAQAQGAGPLDGRGAHAPTIRTDPGRALTAPAPVPHGRSRSRAPALSPGLLAGNPPTAVGCPG